MVAVFKIQLLYALAWTFSNIFYADFQCPRLLAPEHGTISFYFKNKSLKCRGKYPIGSVALVRCNDFYEPKIEQVLHCLRNNSWTSSTFKCLPECGKLNPGVSLIVNGLVATPGLFPWHVAIYLLMDGKYEYWCGGSLISQIAVLTAAHCTWKINPQTLMLAFGKYRREFDLKELHSQYIKGSKIEIIDSYQDASGNYISDLSVIFLMKSVVLNYFARPVCLDWNQSYLDMQLEEGTLGTVLGWGLIENNTFSDYLRILELPVVSNEKCIGEQEKDFKKFVTYTSFCAGFRNGTGVCNGDSGGGLTFLDKESDRWYLQGCVSVSPRKIGTPYCDPNFYTVFTKVSLFMNWLKKLKIFGHEMKAIEKGFLSVNNFSNGMLHSKGFYNVRDPYSFIRPYIEELSEEKKAKGLIFPHTKNILKSALLMMS